MKLGAGIFWLLVVTLFGGAAYFGFHVVRMMQAGPKEAAAPPGEGGAAGGEAAP